MQLRKSEAEQRKTDGWQLVCACQPVEKEEVVVVVDERLCLRSKGSKGGSGINLFEGWSAGHVDM